MKENCVEPWKIDLPSITGQDAFELRRYVSIQAWDEIEEKYRSFIELASNSREIRLCIVIGEWGVGKTSSYNSIAEPLIRKLGHVSVKIKGMDFFDELSRIRAIEKYPIAEATVRALLKLVFDRLNLNFGNAETTIKLLSKLRNKLGSRKLFIFIDEFEDIIERKDSAEIVSGISSLIDGEFEPISMNSIFGGIFHLILSLTPQAYGRLKSQLVEIFGKFDRRISQKIEINKATRRQVFEFYTGYLMYIYDGSLPKNLPVQPYIIDILYRASAGNFGYLVRFLNTLLGGVKSKECDGKFKQLSLSEAYSILKDQTINELGIDRPILNHSEIDHFIRLIQSDAPYVKKKTVLLTFLMTNPVLEDDLISALELNRSRLRGEIRAIKTVFESLNLGSIIELKVVKMGEVHSFLKERIKDKEELSNIIKTIDRLFELFGFYRFEKGTFVEYFAIPKSDDDKARYLEDLKEYGLDLDYTLVNFILPQLMELEGPIAYKSTESIIELAIPPPCPICRASKDVYKAIKIWRKAQEDIINMTVDPLELGEAMIPLLIENYLFEMQEYKINGNPPTIKKSWGEKSFKIRFIPLGILSREKLSSAWFKNNYESCFRCVPLMIIFVKNELASDVYELSKELKSQIFIRHIPLAMIDFAILLGLYRMYKENLVKSKEDVFNIIKIVRDRLNFDDIVFFSELFEDLAQRGFVLYEPHWLRGKGWKELPSVYDYYIVYPRYKMTAEDVYAWVSELKQFRIFREGGSEDTPCSTDIESFKKLAEYETYLEKNDFLKRDPSSDAVKLELNQIERRILFLLKDEQLPKNMIHQVFVYNEENAAKDLLDNLYLKILKRKGFIEIETVKGNRRVQFVKMINLEELSEKAYQELSTAQKEYKNASPDLKKFDAIFVIKKKSYNFFKVSDIIEKILEPLWRTSLESRDNYTKRRLFRTIIRIKKYYFDDAFERVKDAYQKARELKEEVVKKEADLKKLKRILEKHLSSLGYTVDINNFKELKKFKELVDEFYQIWEENVDENFLYCHKILLTKEDYNKLQHKEQQLYTLMDEVRLYAPKDFHYKFGKVFFNPKYYLLQRKMYEIDEIYREINEFIKVLKELKEVLDEIHRSKNKLENELKSSLLRDVKITLMRDDFTGEGLSSLKDANRILRSIYNNSNSVLRKLRESQKMVKPVLEFNIEGYTAVFNEFSSHVRLKNIKFYDDLTKYKDRLNNLINNINKIKSSEIIDLNELYEILKDANSTIENLISIEDMQRSIKSLKSMKDELTKALDYSSRILENAKEHGFPDERYLLFKTRLDLLRKNIEKMENLLELKGQVLRLRDEIENETRDYREQTLILFENIIKTYVNRKEKVDLFELMNLTNEMYKRKFGSVKEEEFLQKFLKVLRKLTDNGIIRIHVEKIKNSTL